MDSSADLPDQGWELLEQYRAELIAQARVILDNLADAEDVVQETFMEALRHRDKLDNARSLNAWLKAINRCNALSRVRGRRSDSARLQKKHIFEPEQTFTTGGFSVFELRETVDKALEELPEDLRQIVRMRYFEHRSYKEIADRMGIPVGNIGGLLMDASVRLYAKLKKQMDTGQGQTNSPAQPTQDAPPQSGPDADDLPNHLVRGAV